MSNDQANTSRSPRRIAFFALLAASSTLYPSSLIAQSTGGFEARTIDGSGNNLSHNKWGQALTALLRHTTAAYADGLGAPAGASRPSARLISNTIAAQAGSQPNQRNATDMVWQWGQFIDHDITLSELAYPAEDFFIAVPAGDPWFDPASTGAEVIQLHRSHYSVDAAGVRQQHNDITAFVDGSMVYGSDPTRAAALRGAGGKLATSPGDLLPFNTTGLANAPHASLTSYFLGGDIRANEQVGLTALHTLFVREHNGIVDALSPLGLSDDANYEIARAIVAAELQAITYNEFLPVLLGHDAMPPYGGYRSDVNPSIANEFSTAAFRIGHTMLSATLLRLDAGGQPIAAGNLALRDAFFVPNEIVQHGIDPLLRGLAAQVAQEVDPYVIDDIRNFLFGAPGAGGFDLASLNIQRGRDHGLSDYNSMRMQYGLPPVQRIRDITRDREVRDRIAAAYSAVNDIDVWIGGLCEDHLPGAMVGPLFHRILSDQFRRLRDGDRFWHESYLPPSVTQWIRNQTLAVIIRRNTGIGSELADDVFTARSRHSNGRRRGRAQR